MFGLSFYAGLECKDTACLRLPLFGPIIEPKPGRCDKQNVEVGTTESQAGRIANWKFDFSSTVPFGA